DSPLPNAERSQIIGTRRRVLREGSVWASLRPSAEQLWMRCRALFLDEAHQRETAPEQREDRREAHTLAPEVARAERDDDRRDERRHLPGQRIETEELRHLRLWRDPREHRTAVRVCGRDEQGEQHRDQQVDDLRQRAEEREVPYRLIETFHLD